jgi:DNA uptake protein ComE-like DNA-binding protein
MKTDRAARIAATVRRGESGADEGLDQAADALLGRIVQLFELRVEKATERVRTDGTKELRELSDSLRVKLGEAEQDAERARAAEESIREEARMLHGEVCTALATIEAMGEQLQKLTAVLYERHAETLPSGPVTRPKESAGNSHGLIDLNHVAAQDLRGLKLSPTQAARLIKRRDELGGFTSLEQLDSVPGLSRKVREVLRQHLSV